MQGIAATRFANRPDAGVRLAQELRDLAGRSDAIVLGLPRGGVPVAFEIARALDLPLDVFVVRKLGVPGQPELAMGAVASGGAHLLNEDVLRELQIPADLVSAVARREMMEVLRRDAAYRENRRFPDLRGRTVVLVDDGIATGATMIVAVRAIRELGPAKVIVAAPVIADTTRRLLLREADGVACIASPESFLAVGAWYDDFTQTSDEEVKRLLRESAPGPVDTPPATSPLETREVRIGTTGVALLGDLAVPAGARGLVIFAHGSGSSRLSPRNRRVAQALQHRGFATLLFDLLTASEEARERSAELRFDIELLTERLLGATIWAAGRDDVATLPIGYFGASTGAAAALSAVAARPELVRTVVSRGGRPDLAGPALAGVVCPTLLIVGSLDRTVIELNRRALAALTHAPVVELQLVPGASHLFEEAGTLDEVIQLAGDWFTKHLPVFAPVGAGEE